MSTEKFNYWLSLSANLGVLVGLIILVVELRQTQDTLAASAHRDRTESNISRVMWSVEQGTAELRRKLSAGQELNPKEWDKLRASNRMGLRHFEDLHFQRTLGNIDDETWGANLQGMSNLANRPDFDLTIDFESIGYRSSFEELMLSLKN